MELKKLLATWQKKMDQKKATEQDVATSEADVTQKETDMIEYRQQKELLYNVSCKSAS